MSHPLPLSEPMDLDFFTAFLFLVFGKNYYNLHLKKKDTGMPLNITEAV